VFRWDINVKPFLVFRLVFNSFVLEDKTKDKKKKKKKLINGAYCFILAFLGKKTPSNPYIK